MKALNLTGMRFGKLTVTEQAEHENGKPTRWKCLCDCGNTVTVRGSNLKRGITEACGCQRSINGAKKLTKHGLYYHSAYATWNRMMQRCHNLESKDYPEYGGRGIEVCSRWHDVTKFIADMGERPKGASIDRIDNSKGYEPGNCRWSNPREQANNTRRNRYIDHDGKRLTISQWERELKINRGTLWAKLNRGVPFELAISQ